MIQKWDTILDNFKFRYKKFADKVVEWHPYGEYEILIIANDGWKYVYDDSDQHLRLYVDRDKSKDYTEQEWREKFSKRLSWKLYRRGLTHEDLSDMTGISRVTISKYINAKATPSTYNLIKIAKALDCTPQSLSDV